MHKQIFVYLVILMLPILEAAPIVFQPCPKREHENPERLLQILKDHFLIVNPIEELHRFDLSLGHHNPHAHLKFKNKKPVCATKQIDIPDLSDKDTIPKRITEATLLNEMDKLNCKKVKRKITYLQREKDCHENINQHIYAIKTREIVVAYEHLV